MKKALMMAAAVLSLTFTAPVFALDEGQPAPGTGPTFEQKKTFILKQIDERITALQGERACVEAAKNEDELRACREKRRAEMKRERDEMMKRVGPRGQGGQSGQHGQGGPGNQGEQPPPPPPTPRP